MTLLSLALTVPVNANSTAESDVDFLLEKDRMKRERIINAKEEQERIIQRTKHLKLLQLLQQEEKKVEGVNNGHSGAILSTNSTNRVELPWTLTSIYYAKNTLFAVIQKNGTYIKVKKNESIGSWKITNIGEDYIIIKRNDIIQKITL